ncbi:MAG TPA: single-stranded DNA-binding protein [Clostridia bacterium]|nr:single-stranded DNA-binding protein [Clostridia bacterium]HRR36036.1 single-stranded DNA-binding protein [Clostridia bacterium]
MQMISEIELLENNKIYIAGSIASAPVFNHQIYGESFYNIIVEVQRLSKQTDMVPVLISSHLLDIDLLKPDTLIEINGQVRSYNNIDKNEKKRLVVNVFAREARILQTLEGIESFNSVFFDSFICKEPNFRITPFGREICDLLIAVNRAYKKSDYIPCICWGRNARYCENMKVGTRLRIWGRFQSREYEKKDHYGNIVTKTAYEVSVIKLEKVEENK